MDWNEKLSRAIINCNVDEVKQCLKMVLVMRAFYLIFIN